MNDDGRIYAELLKFLWEIDVIILCIVFGVIQRLDINSYFEFALNDSIDSLHGVGTILFDQKQR